MSKFDITMKRIKGQRALFIMIVPCMIYTFIFSYLPLRGWIMAFQNFRPNKGYAGSTFVGLQQFEFLFKEKEFWLALRNTLGMSVLNLTLGFIFAIVFALFLNEVRFMGLKKVTQTVSYLPHFLSWIIVTSLVSAFLSTADGTLNNVLMNIGIIDQPILWLGEKKYFWLIVAFSHVWKEMGWNSIIYLAAMTAIDPALYESAEIDGANRYRKMWHITLPGIRSTIIVIMIMNIGWILNAGFEVQYLLGRGLVQDVAQTIDIFVLKYGIQSGNYSLATAAGIFKSVVSITLVAFATKLSRRFGEDNFI